MGHLRQLRPYLLSYLRMGWPEGVRHIGLSLSRFLHLVFNLDPTTSQYCGMLAAQGFVVIAIEHRDGSGPMCSIPSGQGKQAPLFYTKVDEVT